MAYPLSKEEIESIMAEGSAAYQRKLEYKDNPYPKSGAQGRLWIKGYANAHYGSNYANMHARTV